MQEILTLRVELAKLLDFNTYTELSLATKMAENPQQVLDFLENLATRSKAQGERELQELKDFCKTHYNLTALELWDLSFYSEKQKQHLYAINDEELRPYFPEDRVLSGLFELIKRISIFVRWNAMALKPGIKMYVSSICLMKKTRYAAVSI